MFFLHFHIVLFFPLTTCGYIAQTLFLGKKKIQKKTPHRAAVETKTWQLGLLKKEETYFIPEPLVMVGFHFSCGCNFFRITEKKKAGLFANLMVKISRLALNFPVKTGGCMFSSNSGWMLPSYFRVQNDMCYFFKNCVNLVFFFYFFEDRGYFLHLSSMLQMYFPSVFFLIFFCQ